MIGETVSHYRILGKLGGGGMGVVYEAEDRNLGRKVALKFLPETRVSPEALERFKREARAASALNHPHICVVYDLGEHEGKPFLAMERMQGESLKETLAKGPLTIEQVVKLGVQIADGLESAHGAGIVHRDLKPANVFVTERGDAKILDFGLAKLTGSERQALGSEVETAAQERNLTSPGMTLGTVAYMSPEQARGQDVDARSDLFSLGVMLYEMSTGRVPFPGNTAAEIFNALLSQKPAPATGIPATLLGIILRCLEKDRETRYQSASAVRLELERLAAKPRSVLPVKSLAIVGVAILTGAGWLWHRSSRERWVLETAIPEISRLVEEEEFVKAAALTREARAVLPDDPTLEKLWLSATGEASFESVPSGADVSMRPYDSDPDVWESLGPTPLKARIPYDQFVFRVEAPGFAPVSLLDSPGRQWTIRLSSPDRVPVEMVPIPAGDAFLGWPFRVFAAAGVPLPDYLIDRSETTNEEYQRFVDAGGYQNRSFWKQSFIKDGRELSWEEALSHFRDRTSRPGPATWEVGSFPKGQETYPVSGVSWFEAAAYAEYAGKSLPTVYHWSRAAQPHMAPLILPGSNFRGTGTEPVGRPGTLSGFGTTDMAGNVKEWCWNETSSGKRFLLGGGFGDPTYMFNQTDAQSPWERRPNYGFRSVRLATPPTEPTGAKLERTLRDFSSEKPVSEEVFQAFRGLYAYDRTDLNARVEDTEKTERWTRETIHVAAAYGNERLTLHLYLPTNAKPPFQVVLLCPGVDAFFAGEFDPSSVEDWGSDYIMESGRALAFPILKGMFERRSELGPGGPGGNPPALWRDHLVAISKDLGRALDYLETRQDIDLDRVAYQGFSWGGSVAPVLLAVEDRIRVAILFSAGLWMDRPLPEADPFLFAPYVRIPTVMLSDRYDALFSVESSQLPFFRALGTAEEDKRRVIYETGHGSVPRTEEIRETLDWLDKYLGPVRRN